jgi:hypothetical protein
MRSWRDFWRPRRGGEDGHVDPDKIMRELADYGRMMAEVTKVYCAITGDLISKPDTAAHHVLEAAARRHHEGIVDVLDQLAAQLEEAGHIAAARMARDLREDHGGEPDDTVPDPDGVRRALAGPGRDVFTAGPGYGLSGPLCTDTLAIIRGTSPVQVLCRASDLPRGGEDPERLARLRQLVNGKCLERNWRADIGENLITIISGQDAGAAAAMVAETLRLARLGPVTVHDDDDDTAASRDGIHLIDGTWPVQLYVPAGDTAAADLAGWLARSNEGWRAEPAGDGWVTVIPAVLHG